MNLGVVRLGVMGDMVMGGYQMGSYISSLLISISFEPHQLHCAGSCYSYQFQCFNGQCIDEFLIAVMEVMRLAAHVS